MKNLIILSFLLLILTYGCSQDDTSVTPTKPIEQGGIDACEKNEDCIPKPECHPQECINKAHESDYLKPEECTLMFSCNAAYNAEDCACINNKCVNKNLAKKEC